MKLHHAHAIVLQSLLLIACGATSPAGTANGADSQVADSDVTADTDSDTVAPDVEADAAKATDDAAAGDAAIPSGDPLAALGACVGSSQALTVSALMPYATVGIGANSEASGAFVLDFSSTFSSIDLAAFITPPTTSGCDATLLGSTCTVADFHVFGAVYKASLVLENFSGLAGPLRQAGIIGTDFLSMHVVSLSYAENKIFAAPATTACTGDALHTAGLVALSTAGYYQHDLTLLNPYTIVDTTATPGGHVPNVPTVPVRVAGVAALAQLDTGFSDALVSHSVNINTAFLTALQTANPAALVRDATLDTKLTTCMSNVQEPAEAYHLASGQQFELMADDGSVARVWADATIFVKKTPVAAHSCGGIGTWTVPAAQVGASFYVGLGAVIFDPFAAKVWIPKN